MKKLIILIALMSILYGCGGCGEERKEKLEEKRQTKYDITHYPPTPHLQSNWGKTRPQIWKGATNVVSGYRNGLLYFEYKGKKMVISGSYVAEESDE